MLTVLEEALKSLDVIPRTPTPTPLEDRPVEELNPAELAELVSRYRVSLDLAKRTTILTHIQANEATARDFKQERVPAVKREREGARSFEDDDDLSIVEGRPRKRQHLPTEGDEVVVLD